MERIKGNKNKLHTTFRLRIYLFVNMVSTKLLQMVFEVKYNPRHKLNNIYEEKS
jgi:hypothetical protein